MALSISRNPYTGLPDIVGSNGGGGATYSAGLSTLGNTVGDTGLATNRLILAGGNNITLSGSTNGGSMTITISGAAGGAGNTGSISAGTTRGTLGEMVFSNSNGVEFGINGQTVTASHNGLTSQSNPAFSAGGGSSTFQTLSFINANGVTFTNIGGAIRITHGLQFTSGTSNITSNALNTSASRVINVIAATDNTGGGGASLSSNVSFTNANGATFYTSAGNAIALSYTVPTQSAQTVGAYAVSNTTGAASSTTLDARSFSFQGAGGVSVGMTNGSVVISGGAGGAGDGGNILAAGTQTAASTGSVVFSDSNNVTFGMSNSSVITASVGTPSVNWMEPCQLVTQRAMVLSSLLLQRINVPSPISATVMDLVMAFSNSTNAGATFSISAGIFNLNGSTASMLSSQSRTIGFNSTDAASSYSAMSGTRFVSIPLGANITPGDYLMGVVFNFTSSGTSGTYSFGINKSLASFQQEPFAGGNRTRGFAHGVYSGATTALPATIHLTQINQTSNVAPHQPYFMLAGTF